MPFVLTGDVTTHFSLEGAGDAPVLLLANSLGTNFHVWDPVMAELTRHFRVLRYDKRGHGLSDATPVMSEAAGYSIALLAADVLALFDALGVDRAHVCGLSIGGMIAQRLAAIAPERVDRLVLCGTAAVIGPPSVWNERITGIRRHGLSAIAPGVMTRWFTESFRAREPDVIRGYANMVARTSLDGYLGCAMAVRDADLTEGDKMIAAPTLVIAGEQDSATPVTAAQALAALIPDARLATIPNCSHISCVEQPEALGRAAVSHLTR